jgi:2-dehydropantoate 2-reductase
MKDLNWHVLGAGAIGCLYAQALHRSSCETTLIMRRGTKSRFLPVIVEQGQLRSEYQLPVTTPDDNQRISHLLVTTKAYDVRAAVAGVAHMLTENCVIVLLVNGMGLLEQLAREWPSLDIYCGITTAGAYSVAPQHICHAGRGETRLGRQAQTTPPTWFAQWTRAIKPCVWDMDITSALWSKLAVNCVINPLTAVNGCRNGELSENVELAAQVGTLCDEVASIVSIAGFADVAANLRAAVATVIAGTAHNRSSMLQDVTCERPTEIDYITGYLLQVADQHGIDVPHNRALFERIHKIAH